MRTFKDKEGISLQTQLESFLKILIPEKALNHVAIGEVNALDPEDVANLLPEKGPFLFFENCPVAFVKSGQQVFLLGVMKVIPSFCTGHFDERVVMPLYLAGGATGQLCAMYTAYSEKNDQMMPVATEGSAVSLGRDFIDVGSKLFFVVRLVTVTKRGFDFEYITFCDEEEVAKGGVGSMSIPRKLVLRKRKKK